VGILTKEELAKIDQLLEKANYGMIPFAPLMQKDFDTILLERMNKVVYFVTRMDFEQCYKKQPLADFKKSVNELKKDGWKVI